MAVTPIGASERLWWSWRRTSGSASAASRAVGDRSNSRSNAGRLRKPTSLSARSVRTRKLWGIIIGTTTAPAAAATSAEASWRSAMSGMAG